MTTTIRYASGFVAEDGLIAAPASWLPVFQEAGICFDLEPLDRQIHRQRAAAGLA